MKQDIGILIDKSSPMPLYHQLCEQIKARIVDGTLPPGAQLDTERRLMDELCLSYPTVTRALRELVQQGYIERKQGKGTFVKARQIRRRQIALLIPCLRSSDIDGKPSGITPLLTEAIEREAYRLDAEVVLYLADDDPDRERRNLDILIHRKQDAVILFHLGTTSNMGKLEELVETGVPVVLVDRDADGLRLDYVATDNHRGAYMAVNELIGMGFERIHHLTHPLGLSSVQARARGYIEAMREHGLDCSIHHSPPSSADRWSPEGERAAYAQYRVMVKQALKSLQPPAGLFLADNSFVQALLDVIEETGISGKDIAVASFDDPGRRLIDTVPSVIVLQPLEEIGKRSVHIALTKASGNGRGPCRELIEPVIRISDLLAGMKAR